MALDTPAFHNEFRTVEIRGIFYDFSTTAEAATFVWMVRAGDAGQIS